MSPARTLVVVSHPKPESLIRAAYQRVLAGLEQAGAEVRVLDLDADDFDPVLKLEEHVGHLGQPSDRPDLQPHFEALQWCQRLVLVYPTWNSGQPARLKGWFDRTWMHQVAFDLPEGSDRIRGRLRNIRRIDVVTSHGASPLMNLMQGNDGRIRVHRNLRVLCHPLCRVRWHAAYKVDNVERAKLDAWLDQLEQTFGKT